MEQTFFLCFWVAAIAYIVGVSTIAEPLRYEILKFTGRYGLPIECPLCLCFWISVGLLILRVVDFLSFGFCFVFSALIAGFLMTVYEYD